MSDNELTSAIEQFEHGIYTYSVEAIRALGGEFRDLPIKFFRRGAEDNHFRDRAWMVVYDTTEYETSQATLSPHGVHTTEGSMEAMFCCPGTTGKDDSTHSITGGDNWGDSKASGFLTRESARRTEAVICRNVALRFSRLIQQIYNDCNIVVSNYTVTENNPHVETNKYIWWIVSARIDWKLTWS